MMSDCMLEISGKWLGFNEHLIFKKGTPLSEIVEIFAFPVYEFMEKDYRPLLASPNSIFWSIVFQGVRMAYTHTEDELKQASDAIVEKYMRKQAWHSSTVRLLPLD